VFLNCLEGTSTLPSPTEGEDELRILLHTWMETHEILVHPIHRCMLEHMQNEEQHHSF
jgi:hypothetical protein